MTHDELLELINNYKTYAPVDYGQVDLTNALRAVVGLHIKVLSPVGRPECLSCGRHYPCPTIQEIKKELG